MIIYDWFYFLRLSEAQRKKPDAALELWNAVHSSPRAPDSIATPFEKYAFFLKGLFKAHQVLGLLLTLQHNLDWRSVFLDAGSLVGVYFTDTVVDGHADVILAHFWPSYQVKLSKHTQLHRWLHCEIFTRHRNQVPACVNLFVVSSLSTHGLHPLFFFVGLLVCLRRTLIPDRDSNAKVHGHNAALDCDTALPPVIDLDSVCFVILNLGFYNLNAHRIGLQVVTCCCGNFIRLLCKHVNA